MAKNRAGKKTKTKTFFGHFLDPFFSAFAPHKPTFCWGKTIGRENDTKKWVPLARFLSFFWPKKSIRFMALKRTRGPESVVIYSTNCVWLKNAQKTRPEKKLKKGSKKGPQNGPRNRQNLSFAEAKR